MYYYLIYHSLIGASQTYQRHNLQWLSGEKWDNHLRSSTLFCFSKKRMRNGCVFETLLAESKDKVLSSRHICCGNTWLEPAWISYPSRLWTGPNMSSVFFCLFSSFCLEEPLPILAPISQYHHATKCKISKNNDHNRR